MDEELTVSQAIKYLNKILTPQSLVVRGEVGKKINNYSFGTFFDILDSENKNILHSLVWRKNLESSGVSLSEGDEIRVYGHPEIYPAKGDLRLMAEYIAPIGEGKLKKLFEELKRKLKKEGIFSLENKKKVPAFPQKLGLITSRTADAYYDFKKHLEKFGIEVYLYHTKVEGISAVPEIERGIDFLNKNYPQLDAMVIVRGGGSWESLQAFNSEQIARAIFASKIPVIAGVGHEKDETIAGLAADKRVSTPTDAGKFISKNWQAARENMPKFEKNIERHTKNFILNAKEKEKVLKDNLDNNFFILLNQTKENLKSLEQNISFRFNKFFEIFRIMEKSFLLNFGKIKKAIGEIERENARVYSELQKEKTRWFNGLKEKVFRGEKTLKALSPKETLKRGYSVTKNRRGEIIKRAKNLEKGEVIKTKFYKGRVISKIQQKND